MKNLITAALLSLASPAFAEAPDIDGRWVSVAPENFGGPFALREFTFEGDAWRIVLKTFADEAMTEPQFTLDVAGYYRLGAESMAVPGAWNGVFAAFDKTLTAHSAETVEMFGSVGCTLVVDQPFDLTDSACGFFHATMDNMGEYDLIAMRDGQLFLGERSGDLTKARPTALIPYPLVKE
ncbi:hypothetical protein [Tabrizicola sp.]|uniref:hypothetical protein n=1 Tax=Tabrizicola sp. TaxID=2005166 RepID=UPI003F374904